MYWVTVSGESWLADCGLTKFLSSDRGASWRQVAFTANDIAVDGRGKFYAAPGVSVNVLNGATGAVEEVRIDDSRMQSLVVDGAGTLWGARCFGEDPVAGSGTRTLWRFNLAARTVTQVAQGGRCYRHQYGTGETEYTDYLHVDEDGQVFLTESPTTRLVAKNGSLVSEPLVPFATSAGVTLSEGGVGGEGWPYERDVKPLAGYPDYAVIENSGGLIRLTAEGAWTGTGRAWAVRASDGVLLPGQDGRQLELVTGSLDAAVFTGDATPADSAEMIDEANWMRAEVGLPPLLGDALVAQAARNHADYLKLNNAEVSHGESPGTPGFTGRSPGERCAAVGGICGGEVAYESIVGRDAVQGWIATVFHRAWFTWPAITRVGGGFNDRFAIMDAAWNRHFIGAPFGYPRGTYSGPLSFGGEIPDPGGETYCPVGSVTEPYGTAITIALPDADSPGGQPDAIQLRERGQTTPLKGCLMKYDDFYIEGYAAFLPDDPLRPGTTYDVAASWSGRQPDLRWTFTTSNQAGSDDQPTPAKKRLRLRLTKHGHRLTVDANPDSTTGSYRATLQRQKAHKRSWHKVRKLRLAAPKHRRTLRMKSGVYRVVIPRQSGLRGTKSRSVRIR